MSAGVHRQTVQAVDCGKYSSQRTSPECERRSQTAVGVLAVAAVLVLVVGFIAWRLLIRKARKAGDGPDAPTVAAVEHRQGGES